MLYQGVGLNTTAVKEINALYTQLMSRGCGKLLYENKQRQHRESELLGNKIIEYLSAYKYLG